MCCLSNAINDGGNKNADKYFPGGKVGITCCLSNAINDGGNKNTDKYFPGEK